MCRGSESFLENVFRTRSIEKLCIQVKSREDDCQTKCNINQNIYSNRLNKSENTLLELSSEMCNLIRIAINHLLISKINYIKIIVEKEHLFQLVPMI